MFNSDTPLHLVCSMPDDYSQSGFLFENCRYLASDIPKSKATKTLVNRAGLHQLSRIS